MKDSYFILNNNTYILSYIDFNLEVFKFENDQKVPVSESEKEMVKDLLKKHNTYIYSSRGELVASNNESISSDQYAINTIELAESKIPEELREKFYKNLETLKIVEVDALDKGRVSEYNSVTNTIAHLNGADTRKVTRAIVHDLFHMGSSDCDLNNGKILVGYDSIENDTSKYNRGLTEGFTEVLALNAVPIGEDEIYTNGYPIETSLAYQLCQIIDANVMLDAYFNNKGTKPLEKELNELINTPAKAERVFRNMEFNYRLTPESSQTNSLGNVQSDLIDYFDQKLELALSNSGHEITDITGMINRYGQSLITEEMLINMGEDLNKYDGIRESIIKFQQVRDKYIGLMDVPELDENIIEINPIDRIMTSRRAGFGSMLLLGTAAASISIAILLLGMWIGK